jgi:hypothetical protein
MTFKRLPNGKWKYIKEVARGKVDQNDPRYGIKLKAQMKKINPYCDVCKTTYNLASPCEHHLSDSPEHTTMYKELKRKKSKSQTVESKFQQRFK